MKKQEYIARYGIEKYQEYRKQQREYNKQYRQEHREELLECYKQRYQEHREEKLKYVKQYNQTHKEERAEYQKQYYQTQYRRATVLLNGYYQMDKLKGLKTNLTPDWIVNNIFNSKCYYCKETDWIKLGTDRINNTKGHTMDNCICACGKCNVERGDRYSVEEFKRYKQIRPKIA